MPRRTRSDVDVSAGRSPKRSRRLDDGVLENDRTIRDGALGGNNEGRRRVMPRAEYLDVNRALKDIDLQKGSELRVRGLDLHIAENRKAHHTDEYEHECLIVRRGQAFKATLTFDREYNDAQDNVIMQFSTGSRPQESKGTLIRFQVKDSTSENMPVWQAQSTRKEGVEMDLLVTPPADGIIGSYNVFVETRCSDDTHSFQYRREFSNKFILLFNPWCPEDDVFIDNQSWREEYVLNECGRIWQGSARYKSALPWNFGQFEDVCLDAALFLLDRGELFEGARANPCMVIRTISALANSNDDNGVLTGRWTETYPKNSTMPWAWSGSVAILEQFMKKKRPVEFGQCWVFSGIVTTLCRALGIPTRSITNFESAHDSDASMTIDYHWNEEDEPLDDYNDSIWNFHVWNESFFRRFDLPYGYSGWQAHDATPQEASAGVMRCGPASVKAIKEGLVYLGHDAPFIFAEVNGDKVHWLIKDDGSMEPVYKEKAVIGRYISTKCVGSNARNDVTLEYKYPEGSEEERNAVKRAFKYSSRKEHAVYDIPTPTVEFDLVTPDNVEIGKDFELGVRMKNLVDEERTITGRVTLLMGYYTGVSCERVMVQPIKKTLAPNEEVTENFTVLAKHYEAVLRPEASLQAYLRCTVAETKQSYAHQENFNLSKPELVIKCPEQGTIGTPFDLSIEFSNPLKEKLFNGTFHLEGPGLSRSMTITHKKGISPGETVVVGSTLSPRRSGKREIVVSFSSDQLTGVTGAKEIYVKYAE